MNRRQFTQKLSLITSITSTMPFLLYGKTAMPEKAKLKFAIASDGHYGQPNTDYQQNHHMLISALKKEEDLDFVVFNGDLIHDDPKWMPEVKSTYDQLHVPYFPVRGNHDQVGKNMWEDIWGIPTDYAFIHQHEYGLILADSSNERGDYLCADLVFLKEKLEMFKDLLYVFVFIHISQNDWTRHGVACEELLKLFGEYPNIRAIFHGHDHDVNGIMWNRKKPYLWSGHFGGSWGSLYPGYRICEIGEDGKVVTYMKSMKEGYILNGHTL